MTDLGERDIPQFKSVPLRRYFRKKDRYDKLGAKPKEELNNMDRDSINTNPFTHIDAERSFKPRHNVVTESQRQLMDVFLRSGEGGRFICVHGPSGMGRTHVLKAFKGALHRGGPGAKDLAIASFARSYVNKRDILREFHPKLTGLAIEDKFRGRDGQYLVLFDYPHQFSPQDLNATLETLADLEEYANISVAVTLTPSHLSCVSRKEKFTGLFELIELIPFRKEDVSLLLSRRLADADAASKDAAGDLRSRSRRGAIRMGEGVMEYVYGISGGNPRLALLTASTLYEKARDNRCRVIDKDLLDLVSAQCGYQFRDGWCILRTGLSELMRIFLENFLEKGVLEHRIMAHMAERFGWDFNVTRMRLRTLVGMRLLDARVSPKKGWFKQYCVRR